MKVKKAPSEWRGSCTVAEGGGNSTCRAGTDIDVDADAKAPTRPLVFSMSGLREANQISHGTLSYGCTSCTSLCTRAVFAIII